MKNRMRGQKRKKNGKFCLHVWKVIQEVGRDWDLTMGIEILCECKNCGKRKNRSNYLIDEIPDNLINSAIEYR